MRFLNQMSKRLQHVPPVVITDRLKSYGVACRDPLPQVERQERRQLTIEPGIHTGRRDDENGRGSDPNAGQ